MSVANANIEAIYPLSYMQQGMLFHNLFAPQSEVYFDQASWSFQGEVDVDAFKQAWQQVFERHPILRTGFVWKDRDKPLQVVRQQVNLPWELHDWRGASEEELQERLDLFLLDDRARGFDLAKPPLMRMAVIRLTDDLWHFAWSFHHILLDGWGSSILLKEVFTFYEAYSQGQHLDLQRPRPYRDYIGWLQRQDIQEAEAYWRRRLQGFTTPTPLGIGSITNTETAQATYSEESTMLAADTCRALEVLARQQQVTLNTIVQAAWGLLLSRYSGQPDVLFGVTVSGRPAELTGVDQMVGLFINTLPVRMKLDAQEEVGRWLQQLQSEQAEMRQYEYSPLVEVQRWSDAEKGRPLFESILVFENYPVPKLGMSNENGNGNTNGKVPEIRRFQLTNYPITVRVGAGKQWALGITYDTNRFTRESIARMLGHLRVILGEMAAHPRRLLSEMSLLTARERQQLLVDFNRTEREFRGEACVHQMFEAQAARTPSGTALIYDDLFVTYEELNRRANQIAHHLRSLGVGPETIVAIYMHRSVELIVALLGIFKAGAAYLALDPEHPPQRISYMLADSGAGFVLTQSELRETLPPHDVRTICIDSDWSIIGEESSENPDAVAAPHHLAYLIYTSGTTGNPKAVMVEHCSLSNSLLASQATFDINGEDTVPCIASFGFDISLFELMSPLITGGRSVLLTRKDLFDFERFCRLMEEITFLPTLPALMDQFLSYVKEHDLADRYRISKLFVGGDVVAPELIQFMAEVFPEADRYTGYGPTEGTIMCTNHKFARGEQMDGHVIGKPMANQQARIYDEQGQLVPLGVAGELYLGGRGVARGYLNQAELTRAKFVEIADERFYRTGDLARYREDGELEFLGRVDQQVKIRGYRIELGEIEAAIGEHDGVRHCAVVAREDNSGYKRLVAYVVAHEERRPAVRELRERLEEKLPSYMVPSVFVFLEQLPLTENGKVDRKLLPALDAAAADDESEFVRPSTAVEEILAGIWVEVLKTPRVGLYDNFFELGGHSLLATQVSSRIRQSFQVEVPLRAIFESSTLAALAVHIENELKSARALVEPKIVPVSRDEELPLSFAQHRLWFLEQLEPLTAAYNMPGVVRLLGPLNVDLFERSLREIVRRHESLRTRFVDEQGRAQQVICDPHTFNVAMIDVSSLDSATQDQEIRRLAAEEARQPFDLGQVPLMRMKVVRMGEDDHVVLFTMHHIISDGWSTMLFLRELSVLYDAFSRGQASPLPELTIQYADFAAWQRGWLQGEVLEKQLGYWKEQLADVPEELRLPTDRPRPAVQTFRGATSSITLTPELTEAVRSFSRREGSTVYMCLLAAFQTLLARYTGQSDIVVGTPIANRNRREIESLIGFFVNTLVLRTQVDGELTVQEMVRRVREVCLGAYAHQDVPFELLVQELQPERDLSRSPLFQVMFVLQNLPQGAATATGLSMQPVESESKTAKFDLSFFLAEGESLKGTIEYNTDLFDEQTIVRMLGHFETLLEEMVAHPEAKVSDLTFLTAAERQQVLGEWNDTSVDYESHLSLAQLVERQVELRPDSSAVAFGDRRVSYRELNQRANQLAHYLQKQGIGPDALVAVSMERSIDLIVALLGVLKAGGAYVPLDPSYPQERLDFMLQDSGAAVLLNGATDWTAISQEPDTNPVSTVTPANLAYVIYTSGSTGKPKGVQIPHRAVVNFLDSMRRQPGLTDRDTLIAVTSLSFDIAGLEIFLPLMAGSRIVLASRDDAMDGFRLADLLKSSGATIMQATPATWQMLFEAGWTGDKDLTVLCGGEALPRRLANQLKHSCRSLWNMYGPTETTIWSTISHLQRGDDSVTIGKPIANTDVYVLDGNYQPAPIGVPGDLYIGGHGLARGYKDRPELTAEKFIPHPFSTSGERLYRTGDVARRLANGNIAYEGRQDFQVKVRGHRIELGEIESVLEDHQAVKQAVVSAVADQAGDNHQNLAAFLVLDSDAQAAGAEETRLRLSEWRDVWNDAYDESPAEVDPTFNISGWNSSYTGEAIPADEMREWVERTVDRILGRRPKSILEIGCGTGLLLFRLAPHCDSYCGTDFSDVSLGQVRRQLNASAELSNVTLLQREATDFAGLEPDSVDAVVINSVVQYFPGVDYLFNVLAGAARVVRPGGFVFIGDVRSLPLLELFHTSVQLAQSPDSLTTAQLRERSRRHLRQEEELVIDPQFFTQLKQQLPRIGRVEVQLKRGGYLNELSKFRYDVILHVGAQANVASECVRMDWEQDGLTLGALQQRLTETGFETLIVSGIPNARLCDETRLVQMLADAETPGTAGEIRRKLQPSGTEGEEPEDFYQLADGTSFTVTVTWARDGRPGYFDAIFSHGRVPMLDDQPAKDVNTLANNPLIGKWTRHLVSNLRTYLGGRLPEYMVPSTFVVLDAFPLTPNGKIDRKQLSVTDGIRHQNKTEYLAARTDTEKTLVRIWSEVLRVEKIGVNDNFFELGGDSILSVQVVARAKEAGIFITPKDLFQHQTIAGLATAAGAAPAVIAQQGAITGAVELTPIQHWFFDQQTVDQHHFNQSVLLELRRPIDPDLLRGAAQHLLRHHDALRLRFVDTSEGWQQSHAPVDDAVSFNTISLSDTRGIEEAAEQIQSSLDLGNGPLMQIAYFDLGDSAPARLLIVIHHLVVDGISWRILLDDLQRAYAQLSNGEEVQLPPKTTSFQQWATALNEYASSEAVLSQSAYWLNASRRQIVPLPLDYADGDNSAGSSQSISVSLSTEETKALLHEVPAVYHTQITDVLLTALALTFNEWTGSSSVLLDLERHGREQIDDTLDVSRTVGWFTSIHPVLLEIGDAEALRLGNALKSVKEQLRHIPQNGIGYGLLRYLNPSHEFEQLRAGAPQPELVFNYLGQLDGVLAESGDFALAREFAGHQRSPRAARQHVLEINSVIIGGRFQSTWTYSRNLHQPQRIEHLAERFTAALQQIIDHCRNEDAGGYTPSDFPLAQLTQRELDDVIGHERRGVEDVYPLSAMQQGMLFHSLYAPNSQVYFAQLSSPINGDLNPDNFRRAWQQILDNHSVLRTAFVWSGLKQPLQIVRENVALPWEQLDWRSFSNEEQRAKLDQFLTEDRKRGFDLAVAPLMRVALIQMADDAWHAVWSHHHLLLDGWCMPLILKDFSAIYEALQKDRGIPQHSTRPFRDYIEWLQRQDVTKAEEFWRKALEDFDSPTAMHTYQTIAESSQAPLGYAEQTIKLTEEATARLESITRKYQLTLNTLVQGAWGYLLSRYTGEQDVVFGAIVSGRPPELEDVEEMVGVFINTLPVRMQIVSEQLVLNWLKHLQSQQVEARQFEYTPLMMIQKWSDMPQGSPLFESILAFENYPVNAPLTKSSSNGDAPNVKLFQITHYPLSLMVWPAGSRLAIQLSHNARFEPATIARMLSHLEFVLENMLATPAQRVSDLCLLTDVERRRLLVEWNDTATAVPNDLCLHKSFESQVAKTPDNTALVFEGEELTYKQLDERANRLAHFLQSLGVERETLVALYLERSIECVVAMLAVLKAGGAFVPLDTELPVERLSFMIADSAAPVLLTQSWLSDRLPSHAGRTVLLDVEQDVVDTESADSLFTAVTPDSLAYLIYTSGTSGKPKAVMVEHRNLLTILLSVRSEFRFTENDVVPCIASFSFDISLLELLSPLLVGAQSLLVSTREVMDLERLTSIIQSSTFFHLTPGLLRQLVNYLRLRPVDVSGVRQIFTGGDLVPTDLMPDVAEVFPQARLFIGYGPTEGAVISTGYHIPASGMGKKHIIGRPLANVNIRVYDKQNQLVPVGIAGELYLGGAGVARGYLNRRELTAEKFIVIDGQRFYRTGDMVRYLDDGNLEFLGRGDQQVKIRGYRIEVEEIENVLSEHAKVEECVIGVREDTPGDKRLVAYVVPARGRLPIDGAALNGGIQLWPSIGEYFVYDELIYYGLTNDERRNQSYHAAIRKTVKDKVVLEIGTGRDAVLARMCVEAGAKKVYAVEILEESFNAAKKRIEALGLSDKVVLLHGDATRIELPEKADVCVSEIVDAIGGAEGAAVILNGVKRLLKQDAAVIPERSITRIAAVTCPDEVLNNPSFTEVSGHYVERIFAEVGHRFDLRLAIKNFPETNIISSREVFEDLDFRGEAKAEFANRVSLMIEKDSTLNGFLLWLNLHVGQGEMIDIIDGRYSWFPVYFPVFHPGVEVKAGDRIEAVCSAALCDNGITPGYVLEGKLIKRNGDTITFTYDSLNHREHYKQTPFYRQLFQNDSMTLLAPEAPVTNEQELKEHLRRYLPEYMVPTNFVMLDSMPLTQNGKVDHRALLAMNADTRATDRQYVAPKNAIERELKEMWEEMLNESPISVTDNFFELGGNSLLALRLVGQLEKQFEQKVPLATIMTESTIQRLARFIEKKQKEQVWSPLVGIQTNGTRRPFYCVHPGGGNVLAFYEMGKCFGPEQPFYGLQAPGLIDGQEPPRRIEDFAACYVRAIREFQPEGPYLLGGYSSGGVIAFEMAQQLQREGHEVAMLAMLDCYRLTGERDKDEGDDARLISIFARTMNRILTIQELRQVEPEKQIEFALQRGREANLITSFVEEQQVLKTFELLKALREATRSYKASVYPGTITLFRPEETTAEITRNIDRLTKITNVVAAVLSGVALLLVGLTFVLPWAVLAVITAVLAIGCLLVAKLAREDALTLSADQCKGLARIKPLRAIAGGIYRLRADREDLKGTFDLGPDFTLGWGAVSAQPVEVRAVPGNHLSIILQPDVQALADSLNDRFSKFN